jgi:hypothetical protein
VADQNTVSGAGQIEQPHALKSHEKRAAGEGICGGTAGSISGVYVIADKKSHA